ncbi:hypothetical protein VM1G_10312 [Cytospora mali]|uniref:Uncharacterized protein n=1 Tax=Cytospora mali TaxID=578113 RepID=A0A194VHI5_CYTMA|nr:hypothetical protein VM1G_10312 [Valsa mali]
MGRTLPWKKGDSTLAVTKSSNNQRPTSNASRPLGYSPSPSTAGTPIRSAAHSKPMTPISHPKAKQASSSRAQTSHRSPSSSPPPEPIPESFVIEGFDNDDQWRMVEDEFYAVAGHFTAHLHAAEYRRLREEARNQNADSIRTISRPVTAPPTSHVKRRQAALALATAQRQGVKAAMPRINGEETEDEDDEISWKGTHLAGLMNSPRKRVQPLTNMTLTAGDSHTVALSSRGNGPGSPSASRGAFARHHENLLSTRDTSSHRASGHLPPETSRSRTKSQQVQALDDSDDDNDLEQYSSRRRSILYRPQPGTIKIETSRSSQSILAPSSTGVTSAPKEISTARVSKSSSAASPPVSTEHGSDSEPETYFQRRMRERRGQRKSSRHTSTTPIESDGKDESQSTQRKSQESQNAVLAVPSF